MRGEVLHFGFLWQSHLGAKREEKVKLAHLYQKASAHEESAALFLELIDSGSKD